MTEIFCSLIAAFSAVMVAVFTNRIKKENEKVERRSERRKKETMLSLQMMSATMHLSIVCANAVTGGHNNGNVEAAKEEALKAEQAYKEFERELLSEEIA